MPEDPVDPVAPTPPPEAEEPTYPSLEELAQLLPQYEIHEIIGIGGMGAVYKGRQIALDRLVAIKVMPAASAQNPEDVQRFIKEARSMAKLVHPHIVAVFDFGQTYARHLFLVMEYVEGCDLHRRTRRKEITTEKAREVIAQLCDALQFAHDRGVAHRDIKPANILITNDWKVKVADFGLARDLSALPNPDEVEYGTPDYTAPERLITGANVDHRADIYALGVVIHEMLTGKTPTAAGKDAGKGLPHGFANVITKCLMSEPEARYQKASEVKVALLTATAEKQRTGDAAPAPAAEAAAKPQIPFEPPEHYTSYRPSLAAKLSRMLAPAGWGIASVLVLAAFAWLIFKDRVSIEPAEPKSEPAKPAEVAVQKPEPVKAPEPMPAVIPPTAAPAPPAPAMAVAKPTLPAPDKPVVKPAMPELKPYAVPEGAAGEVARLDGHAGSVFALQLLGDQNRVLSGGVDGTLRLWDLSTQKQIYSVEAGLDQLSRLQISADETQALVLSYRSDKLALIELATGKTRHSVSFPDDKLQNAVLLKDSQTILASGFGDEGSANLLLWKPDSGNADLIPVSGYAGRNYSMMLTPEGSGVILSASKKDESTTGVFRPQLTHFVPASSTFTKLDAGPLGYITRVLGQPGTPVVLVTASTPKVISLPDMKVLLSLPEITKGSSNVISAEIVDAGRLLLTGWDDSTLRAIDIPSGEEVWRQTTPEPVTSIALSKDQRWAVLSTRYKDGSNQQQGDFDLLVWRLPKWSELESEKSMLASIAKQMANLEEHDAELATLRASLRERAALPTQADLDTQRQKLDEMYVVALRRDYPRSSPTDQQAIKAEIERIALQGELPAPGLDASLPPVLQKLRGIYRQQLASFESVHHEATKTALQSVDAVLKPLMQKRESAGDKLGALRVKAVLKEWQQTPNAPVGDGAPLPIKSGTAVGTPTKRPDRPGSIVAIQRLALNTSPMMPPMEVSRIPRDLGQAVAIAGASEHVFALLPDGKVRGWGNWNGSAVVVPSAAADVVQIDSTNTSALALLADGHVIAWGPDNAASGISWKSTDGRAPVRVYAGEDGTGYVHLQDGTIQPVGTVTPAAPAELSISRQLIRLPIHGWIAILPRDGLPLFWGNAAPPVIPLPVDLKDIISLSISSSFGVALQRDGTMTGWGQLAQDQRYRTRKLTSATKVYHDYAERVFPVHRSDHSWELVPNPSVPEYVAEDRGSVTEGRLRGAIDAVFTREFVIALKP
jgi:serine/threonine protein kinase